MISSSDSRNGPQSRFGDLGMVFARPPYFILEMAPPRLPSPPPQKAKGSEGSFEKSSIEGQSKVQYR